MKIKNILLLFLLFSFGTIAAQDIIVKKDGTEMKVIIKEVSEKTIKYVDYKDPRGIIFTIDKVLIAEVKFEYGKEVSIQEPKENTLYFADDKIHNFLFNFIAFGGNTLGIAYEKALKPGKSIMLETKIYGLGIKPEGEVSRSGFGLQFSYRLKTKSLFNKDAYRPKHLLHGAYFAPSVGFSSGEHTYETWFFSEEEYNKHTIFYFGLDYGKQFVVQRELTIDASIGLYYYLGDHTSNDEYLNPVRLGNMRGIDNTLISFNLRIGFLTGKQRIKNK